MNPQMTEPAPTFEHQPLPSVEAPEMETLAEVGGVSVSVESEPLEREHTPEILATIETLPNPVETPAAPLPPSINVFDIPIELAVKELPQMPTAGLFVTRKNETKPVRPPRPAEGLNTAGKLEWELAA